jgi:uncharacterized membrane protein YebE (DUF533 family)
LRLENFEINRRNSMAGLTDLLGSLVQSSLASSQAPDRMGNALGASPGGGGLSDIIGSIGQMIGGAGGPAGQGGAAGGLGSLVGGLGGSLGGLGGVLSGLAGNKAAMGGLGALAGALMGGGGNATRGAIGGGALAMLASLAMAALKNAGQTPAQTPSALLTDQTPQQQAALEADATILVKAMINAAKADGEISQQEKQKIFGKLSEDGLQDEAQQFFQAEAGKPMNTQELVNAAQGRPELAAQIYAASLLVIDTDKPEDTAYLRDLAAQLGLSPAVTGHIEKSLGL